MFVDDEVNWASAKNNNKQQRTLEKTMNHSLEVLNAWATENMMINNSKTMYQFFSLQHNNTDFNLKIDNQLLQKSASTKYLGVLFDNKLNWADHINKTVEKTNKRIRLVKRLAVLFDNKLNWADHINKTVEKTNKRIRLVKRLAGAKWGSTQDTLKFYVNTYVKPIMKYGSEVTEPSNKSNLNGPEQCPKDNMCSSKDNTSYSPSTIHRKPASKSGNTKTSSSHLH